MTQEEKAKAYDEAIKRLEDIKTGKCQETFIFTEGLFDYIFPELQESEDERVRKELIEFVKSRGGFKQEYITWLERQGEKEYGWSEEDKNMLEWVIGYLENKMLNAPISEERTSCKNAIAWFKEKLKGEQKPVEWTMDNIEELTEFENAMMHIGGSFFGEHQGLDPNDTFVVKEQAKILLEMATKQELSEEDARL